MPSHQTYQPSNIRPGISARNVGEKVYSVKAKSSKVAAPPSQLIAEIIFWPARILLLAMVVASPWYYGSVTWQAQTYYLPVAAVTLVLAIIGAMLRKESPSNPLVWSMAGLLSIALMQTTQIPEWLWQSVSASASFERQTGVIAAEFLETAAKVPSDLPSDQIQIEDTPRTLSIHWVQTRASICTFAVALALLVSAGILFRTAKWEVALLIVLAISGLSIAALGMLQSVAWNKWTLLPMPTRTYFATFVSRNSAPQFLAVGLGGILGVLTWWNGLKSDEADKRYYVRYPAVNALARFRRRLEELVTDLDAISLICIFSATLIFVAVLTASSRGGILSCIAAGVLTLCISLGTKKSYASSVATVTLMGCGAMLLLTTLELDSALWERMDSVNEEAYELNNGRFLVWKMILSEPRFWLPGCGLGNFHFAILPTYKSEPTAWFYHAENIYVELLTEFGLLGFVIGMAGLGWLVARIRWCIVTGRRSAPTFVAIAFAVSAVALQSLVDFSLIIPGICFPLVVLVGCFIGRSYSSDYGRKSKHRDAKKQESRKPSHREEPLIGSETRRATFTSSIALLTLILFSFWVGAKPLAGYAFAERLTDQLNALQKLESGPNGKLIGDLIKAIDVAQAERFADHPEVNLQIGRLLQTFAGVTLAEPSNWPAEVPANQRKSLSEPANVAAAYRSKDDPRMAELRELTKHLPQQIESLRRSAVRMAAAASTSSFDWRSGLGVLRSDLNWFSAEDRARNYARLSQLTGQSSQMPASIGAAALLAGEKQIGYRFLHDHLSRIPNQSLPIALSIIQEFPEDKSPSEIVRELQQILPDSLLSRAEVAEELARNSKFKAIANQLAQTIDLEKLTTQAAIATKNRREAKPWLLVAWLAEERQETDIQIEAIRSASQAEQMNHALHFKLAQLLLANDRRPEALEEAKRAWRQSPETQTYREFVEKIQNPPTSTDE